MCWWFRPAWKFHLPLVVWLFLSNAKQYHDPNDPGFFLFFYSHSGGLQCAELWTKWTFCTTERCAGNSSQGFPMDPLAFLGSPGRYPESVRGGSTSSKDVRENQRRSERGISTSSKGCCFKPSWGPINQTIFAAGAGTLLTVARTPFGMSMVGCRSIDIRKGIWYNWYILYIYCIYIYNCCRSITLLNALIKLVGTGRWM